MKRIPELFKTKSQRVLSVYCTAGYPRLNSTITVMKALQDNGADMIELGMPYSDPLADGPVIQQSSAVALANGMTIPKLFEQLDGFRNHLHIPVILMGYMNPVLQYGFEKFCADAAAIGIDGLILPDLPPYEFETAYSAVLNQHGLDFIFLVTPETSEERVMQLDRLSSGFLYAVSSSSTTGGSQSQIASEAYLQRLNHLPLQNPVLVGFGIKDKAGFEAACQRAHGAIIGSAYIQALGSGKSITDATRDFLSGILA